jgi:transposase InsO family protein
MNIHRCARSCPRSRALLVHRVRQEGWPPDLAADAAGLSTRTVYKWLARFDQEGRAGLEDRSSRPASMPGCRDAAWATLVSQLRRCRMSGPLIAKRLRLPRSTVGDMLRRQGLGKLKALDPVAPVVRYTSEHPGDLLHLDVKKLARFDKPGHRVTGDRTNQPRGGGYEYVHVCIDDATRVAYVEILADEKGPTTAGFLRRAVEWYRRQGITVRRIMTDNGKNYTSHAVAEVRNELGLRHLLTRPYRPATNGKAERFIQTLLREWAYARPYPSSSARRRQLPRWLLHYNARRPHGSLEGVPPFNRLLQAVNNLPGFHI